MHIFDMACMALRRWHLRNRSVQQGEQLFFFFFFVVLRVESPYAVHCKGIMWSVAVRLIAASLAANLHPIARAFVFSRTPIVKNAQTTQEVQEALTGMFSLRNEETISMLADVADLHVKTGGIGPRFRITAEKGPVLFAYDLVYEMDVFSDFTEDAYEYSYKNVGKDPARFCYIEDLDRCQKTGTGIARAPNGVPLPWSSGKCCWCGDATLTSTRDEPGRRAALRCGGFDAFLGRSVWAVKTCPRVIGPWYSAFSFGPWRWEYTVRVTLEWDEPSAIDDPARDGLFSSRARAAEYECIARLARQQEWHRPQTEHEPATTQDALRRCVEHRTRVAGTQATHHILNATTPGISDDAFRIRTHITGSHPQTDAIPPPLNDKVLFVPTYPKDHPLVQASRVYDGCGEEGVVRDPQAPNATCLATAPLGSTGTPPIVFGGAVAALQKLSARLLSTRRASAPASSCLSHVLLIPKSMTDFSGIRCDVIGTSLRKWGDLDGQFCTRRPGACMGNQLGPLRREDEDRIRRGIPPKYFVTQRSLGGGIARKPRLFLHHADDIKDTKNQFRIAWEYAKEHTTTIEVELVAAQISWLQASSQGVIQDVHVETPCTSLDGSGCVVDISCINQGTTTGRFVLTVPYCVDAVTEAIAVEVKPVGAVGLQVEPNATRTVSVNIQSANDSPGFFTCKVVLADENDRRLDHTLFNVSMNAPTHQYQGLQAQPWAPNVNISFVDKQGRAINFGQLLQGFSAPLKASSLYTHQCDCGLFNVLCIFANFFGCLARARTMIVSSIGVVGLAATTYICGPSATFCLKCCGRRLVEIRERQKAYLSTETKADACTEKTKGGGEGRPSTTGVMGASGTPRTRRAASIGQNDDDDGEGGEGGGGAEERESA